MHITVVLILSSSEYRDLGKIVTCVCIIPRLLLVKQGTFLYEAWPDLAEKRDIRNTGILTSGRKSNIEILFIDELLLISESRTLYFSNSGVFMDGRNKESRAIKLKIN